MEVADDADYIDHALLTDGVVERRPYQIEQASGAQTGHTLVCLPTGLGKTTVSLLVTAQRLEAEAGGKALFLAPTKPLVEQHAEFYRRALDIPDDEIVVFTGEVSPDDRAELWSSARVVIATPQVVENDLIGGRIDLRDVVHLTFDECHRATGDYAYVYIAERYHPDAADPLVTGMSASPGGDEAEIQTVCENLGIDQIEVKTDDDPQVTPFTHDTDIQWIRVTLPDSVIEIRELLNEVITDRLETLKSLGVTSSTDPSMSQKDLNEMRGELQRLIEGGNSDGYTGMSAHAEIMKLRQAVTYAETQSVESLRRYFERQRNAARSAGASKASQRMVSEPKVQQAMKDAEEFDGLHPKFRRARMLLAETLGIENGERVIVFTESRDTAETLTEFLGQHFSTRKFVGQGDRDGSDGMTQTQQTETLDAFRDAEFDVLVSTSVAEEGLDVPEVDLVCFFEPVPTAIRSIQRKGRTGRQSEGRVVVLLAEDTRDEAYFWISKRREEEMSNHLEQLQSVADEVEATLEDSQEALDSFETNDAAPDPETTSADGGETASGDGTDTNASDGQTGLAAFDEPETDSDGEQFESEHADSSESSSEQSGSESATAVPNSDASSETVEIVVDQRELESTIARVLSKRDDVETRLETLDVGDYVLSDRVAVERKTVPDFLDSVLGSDRSLFEQIRDTAANYDRPVVLIEGDGLYEERNVHPNAIRGAVASLAVDFDASVLRTTDESGTTELLEVIASREQTEQDREVSVHGEKAAKTLAEQQEYVVASIAAVGPVTARSLLAGLGSVESVLTADEAELKTVDGVGRVTAERIREVVGSAYDP